MKLALKEQEKAPEKEKRDFKNQLLENIHNAMVQKLERQAEKLWAMKSGRDTKALWKALSGIAESAILDIVCDDKDLAAKCKGRGNVVIKELDGQNVRAAGLDSTAHL